MIAVAGDEFFQRIGRLLVAQLIEQGPQFRGNDFLDPDSPTLPAAV